MQKLLGVGETIADYPISRMTVPENLAALVSHNVPLEPHNTFGIQARAETLLRVQTLEQAHELAQAFAQAAASGQPVAHRVLGGGSNLVITGDVKACVVQMAIGGMAVVADSPTHTVVQAGAGVNWHDFVQWTVEQGHFGLENLALIPGTVGGAPVQNVGAYGVEVKDRFESLDAVDLISGDTLNLNAEQCAFAYRDSVFKHALAGRALITQVRFRLRKPWVREIGYADLTRKAAALGNPKPTAAEVFNWVCEIRQSKLPDWRVLGNAGSFFKNPTVGEDLLRDIIAREPKVVHYPLGRGQFKLAAAWLIDACGWKGKSVGHAAVHEQHALVLVNRGGCTGGEVMTLAKAIQTSVYERFGIQLQPEPVVW
jgi:UDP-N-acetylmuramate dehydrogenase